MRQFFIPTSSLNFNNIFSTESISPAAFYAQRGFGYSRWTSIPENGVDNAVLLYDTPRNFSRPISDLEDHPMLIEFRTNEKFLPYADGVYYSDHTIYLNPWNTRVWFFSEKDKRAALSLSDSSLETKLIRLYERRILYGGVFDSFYSPTQASFPIELNTKAIELDRRINRLKGLLYGYYIGAAKSVKPERAELIHTLYVIQDTFAAIAFSPNKTATPSQEKELKDAFALLREHSPFFCELVKITESHEKALEVVSLLEKVKAHTPLDEISLEHHLSNLRYDQSAENSSFRWVQQALDNVCNNSEVHLLDPDSSELIVIDKELGNLKYEDDSFIISLFIRWVNGLFMGQKYNGKISAESQELATDLTLAARDVIGDEAWTDSPIRAYLNNLRRLVNGDGVEIEWNNGILSSVAAVVYKGDDWDKLLRFMQFQNMNDYRIAFATYGLLNGFANLTRDLTDILLNQNSDYVASIYEEFNGQLFAQGICKEKMPPIAMVVPVVDKSTQPSCPVQEENGTLSDMIHRISDYLRSAGAKDKRNSSVEQTVRAALEEYTGVAEYDGFLKFLAKYASDRKAKEPWKSLNKILNAASSGKNNAKSKVKQPSADPTLFDENLFYCDPRAIGFLRSVLDSHQIEEVMWFFEDIRKPDSNRKYYKKVDEKNNKKVIDLFCKSEKIIQVIGTQKMEQLKEFLYRTYGIR